MAPTHDQKLSQLVNDISNVLLEPVESNNNFKNSIPPQYTYFKNPNDFRGLPGDDIPIIDYSLFTSSECDDRQRSKMIQQLGNACQNWSFFIVINHGLPESLTSSLMDASDEFFSSPESKKIEYTMNKDVVNGIRVGDSGHSSTDNSLFWRNYIKMFIRPDFQSPSKPQGFRDALLEFNTKQRVIAEELLKWVSKSLELEENYISKITDRKMGTDFFGVNVYPPCPQPELAVGLSPHTDFGLLVFLMQNGVDGLQIQHGGKWYNVNAPSNSIMVGLGDQMEVLTNGRYKSFVHRATVNKKRRRMSIATLYGPSFDTVVAPAPALVDEGNNRPMYRGMKYVDYYKLDQTNKFKGTTTLDLLRIDLHN